MNRKQFTYILLGLVLGWLILSYLPELQQYLPVIGFSDAWHVPLMWIGVIVAALFLGIQVWVVGSTVVALRRRRNPGQEETSALHARLNLPSELFWTALPILMTVLLIMAGYWIWEAR